MGLCGSFRCGCGVTSTPAVSGAIGGELPSILVSGSGEAGDPFDLQLNDAWAAAAANRLVWTCTSGTRPTGIEGRFIYETDTDLLYIYNGTGWEQVGGTGGWTSYTPTLAQGVSTNITKTVDYAKWTRGPRRTITVNIGLVATGTGTAGSIITVSLPVAAAAASAIKGAGAYFDSGVGWYPGFVLGNSASTAYVVSQPGGGVGAAPNIAVANNDQFHCAITYEAAS